MDFSALGLGLGFGRPQQPPGGGGIRKGGRGGVHKKQCNCKNSRCLKLYCECFASGRYCEGCNCSNCFNNHENEHTRQSAVEAILERNPNAFRPKIQAQDDGGGAGRHLAHLDAVGKHSKGCNCKKSACLKKYCECFQAGVYCSDSCKCIECKNYEGSEQRAQVMACINMQPGAHVQQLLMDPTSPAALASPMKRMRTMTGSVPGLGMAMPAQAFNPAAAAAAVAALNKPPALPQPAPRPVLHQVVGDIVKGSVIEELCRLLFLVADEEAERQLQGQPAPEAVSNSGAAAAAAAPGAAAAAEGAAGEAAEGAAGNGGSSSDGDAAPAPAAAAAAAVPDAATALARQSAQLLKQLCTAQERVVLEEFYSMFRKMTDTANKKAQHQQQQTAAATAAAAAAAAVAAARANTGAAVNAAGLTAGLNALPPHLMAAAAAAAAAAVMNQPQAQLSQAAAGAARPGLAGLTSQQAAALQAAGLQMLAGPGAGAGAAGAIPGLDAALAAMQAATAAGAPSFTSMLHDPGAVPASQQLLQTLAAQGFAGLGGGSTTPAPGEDSTHAAAGGLQQQAQPLNAASLQQQLQQGAPQLTALQQARQQVLAGAPGSMQGGLMDAGNQLALAALLNLNTFGGLPANHKALLAGGDGPQAAAASGGSGAGAASEGRAGGGPYGQPQLPGGLRAANSSSLPPAHAPP